MIFSNVFIAIVLSALSSEARLVPLINITNCGRRGPVCAVKSRVFYGISIPIEEVPWIVGLVDYTEGGELRLFCTGFIVSKDRVITAAHCIGNIEDAFISFGSRFWAHGKRTRITDIWTSSETKNTPYELVPFKDIAVLTVEEPFVFRENVMPICIAANFPAKIKPYKMTRIAGFGRFREYNKSNELRSRFLFLHEPNDCRYCARGKTPLPGIEICASADSAGIRQGDSGSPLMIEEDGVYYAVGVASFSSNCWRPKLRRDIFSRLDTLKESLVQMLSLT